MSNSQSQIFVTGATGFLGSYLVRLLVKKGYRVVALHRATSEKDLVKEVEDQITWVEGDILDVISLEEAMEGCSIVFHCAAMVSYEPKRSQEMMKINVEGTANVVDIALHLGIEQLIYVSSIAALGKPKFSNITTEKTPWEKNKNTTQYSISKFRAEQEVWRAAAEGLAVSVINPSVILGSGRWQSTSVALFYHIFKGLSFYPLGGTGFVDVRDVARIAVQMMEEKMVGQKIIVNAENLSFKEVFTWMAQHLNKKAPSIKVTPLIAALGWRWFWLVSKFTGKAPIVTRESTKNSGSQSHYDASKSIALLNFNYTPIQQTIQETSQQLLESKGQSSRVLDF